MHRRASVIALATYALSAVAACSHGAPVFSLDRKVRAVIDVAARPDGSEMSYFVLEPEPPSRYPVVVYLGGSGCRSNTETLHYFPTLLANGYAVVAPERRGVRPDDTGKSCSEEFLHYNDRFQRIADIDLAISAFPARLTRWDGRLVVIGGSEGAAVAPEIATRHRASVALLLMGGGALEQARELQLLQERELRAKGATPAELQRSLAEMDARFHEIEGDRTSGKSWLGAANTYRMWASYLRYRPLDFLTQIAFPIYMVNGTMDSAVPIESAEAAVVEFRRLGKSNLTIRRYDSLDHRWSDPSGRTHLVDVGMDLMRWLYQNVPTQR